MMVKIPPPQRMIIGANGRSAWKDKMIPKIFIICAKTIDRMIIVKGEVEMILALIAGIRIILVTRSVPTILIVASTENESKLRKINSIISTLIPRDEATSLLIITRIIFL